MKSVSKKGRGRRRGRRRRGRPPSLREKPVCGLSSHSAKLRAENDLKATDTTHFGFI